MNPFLYKAHPLQYRLVELLLDPAAHSPAAALRLLLLVLALNLLWTCALIAVAPRLVEGLRLSPVRAYGLALPSCLVYAPLLLTVLGDVLGHAFRLEDRYILIFALIVAGHMLAGFYGLALRARNGRPAGLRAGMSLSLALFLASLPLNLLLLPLDAVWRQL